MYVASLYPDRITVRYEKKGKSVRTQWEEKMTKVHDNSLKNLSVKKSSWGLSYQSKRKIRDSVAYMATMAKPRTIKTPRGKLIYNFKTSFITLTLPSKQIHTDKEIKQCLNNFLTTLRQRYGLKNYVWKAELQANENIHFHIITDIYIHHTVVRYHWNKALNVLGYVDSYAKKFSKLSLEEYARIRGVPIAQAVSGFLYGRNTEWKSPSTEQVKAVRNSGMLSYYVSKYVAKDVSDVGELNVDDVERIKNFGRVWGRSQSLSKISFVTRYCWQSLKDMVLRLDRELKGFHKVEFDYCTVYYFDFKNITDKFKKWLFRKMGEIAVSYNYPVPI